MDRAETTKLLALIRATYPMFYRDAPDMEAVVSIWQDMFAGDPFIAVQAAFKAFVTTDTKGFPPHIGALKERIDTLKQKDELTEMQAWALVKKALKNGYYGHNDEYAKLPEDIQVCLGDAKMLRDWSQMDTETVDSVVASNFMRSYKARAGHAKEMRKLPEDVRKLFMDLGDALALPATEDDGHD